VCDLGDGCEDRIPAKIDVYEEMFLNTVSKNTGLTVDEIVKGFNEGDTIFAKDALELGFLDGIATFHDILNREVKTLGATPTATGDKLAKNPTQGTTMTQEELLAQVQTLADENAILSERISSLVEQPDAEAAVAEAREQFVAQASATVLEAIQSGASGETIVAMLKADTPEAASEILIKATAESVIGGEDGGQTNENPYAATVEQYGGTL
jgi:ClpP class serine protease